MKKGRFKRNVMVVLSGMIALIHSICIDIYPSTFENYSEIMSASLSYSALATALFISMFSLIPAFSNSKLIKILVELGTDKKLMDRLLIATTLYFLNSTTALVSLYFNPFNETLLSKLVVTIWYITIVTAIVSTFYILKIVYDLFDAFSK